MQPPLPRREKQNRRLWTTAALYLHQLPYKEPRALLTSRPPQSRPSCHPSILSRRLLLYRSRLPLPLIRRLRPRPFGLHPRRKLRVDRSQDSRPPVLLRRRRPRSAQVHLLLNLLGRRSHPDQPSQSIEPRTEQVAPRSSPQRQLLEPLGGKSSTSRFSLDKHHLLGNLRHLRS